MNEAWNSESITHARKWNRTSRTDLRLSSKIVVKNCQQTLSSKIVIKNCLHKLSSQIVIKNFHQKLSSKIIIKNCHRKLSSKMSSKIVINVSKVTSVSGIALCMAKVKVTDYLSEWLSQWVTRPPIELIWAAEKGLNWKHLSSHSRL